jgi:hypothetical protein
MLGLACLGGVAAAALLGLASNAGAQSVPFRLHPQNPHYFEFRGKPTILITSAEHYGAVLNLDFDYRKYLDTLAACGLNHTRTFVGAYCEPQGAFKIANNTLAPAAGRFICPWARSDQPGYANGGNKFDLSRWDEAYFARLRDFISLASERGIVVEVNLWCPFYADTQWVLSPMNPGNNINGIGELTRADAYTLDRHAGLLAYQEGMTRKVVESLAGFDNVYFEIMNEPYVCKVPDDWQRHIAGVIVDAEKGLAHPHLISQNIANHKARAEGFHPSVGLLNFHYAWPPETVGMNWEQGRAIGDNETGFRGTGDAAYRTEGWAFILAGGALYNNLDYTFTVGHEDGSFVLPSTQPGGGGAEFRRQMGILRDFINGFDFLRMSPSADVVAAAPAGVSAFALAEPGRQYAVYLCRAEDKAAAQSEQVTLKLAPGRYLLAFTSPTDGPTAALLTVEPTDGTAVVALPAFARDLAVSLRRME